MIQSHKNTDFLHNLPLFVFFFCSDTLACNLSMGWCVHSKVNGGKGSTSETLWRDDISTDSLQGRSVEGSTKQPLLTLWVGCWGGVGSNIFAFSFGSFQMWTHLNSLVEWSTQKKFLSTKWSKLSEEGISSVSPSMSITNVFRIMCPLSNKPFVERS